MYAAVVTAFDAPPVYQQFPTPAPGSDHVALVDVIAAGLHPRVRSQANGSHYTSTDDLPLIPGVDGVGRAPDGSLRYFILPDTTMGSMAEQTLVDLRRSVVLPDGVDPVEVAAAMNPAMSSWVALRRRIPFQAGQSVLVLAATGNAGQLAIQIAKRLGAGRVIGAGRGDRLDVLPSLGADEVVSLAGNPTDVAARLGHAAANIDVVIDYLWGQPTADALTAIVTNRADDSQQPLTWIQVGSVAGLTAPIPSAALRAVRLQIVGSGQGSVPTQDVVAELPELAREISAGTLRINARAVPLRDVGAAWTSGTNGTKGAARTVITP